MRANTRLSENLGHSVHYGLAVQSPLTEAGPSQNQSVHMFIEALGRYHFDAPDPGQRPPTLELVPGLHWQMGDNWWMSSGVSVPLGGNRTDAGMVQITCSWRF